MAWTAPITFVAGVPLTAAQLNAIQANLLETAVAKATTVGRYFVAAGANSLVERFLSRNTVDVIGTTTSTSYTDTLSAVPSGTTSGPTTTKDTGASCIVGLHSYVRNNTAGISAFAAFRISGATTRVSSDADAIGVASDGATAITCSAWQLALTLTPGSNTFTAQYRVTDPSTGTFDGRRLTTMPF